MMCYTLLSGQMFSHHLEVEPGSTRLLGAVDDFEKVTSGFEGISVFTEGFCHLGLSTRVQTTDQE